MERDSLSDLDSDKIVEGRAKCLPLPPAIRTDANMLAVCGSQPIVHDFVDFDSGLTERVYYVTDLHLEHQLDLDGKSFSDARAMVAEKITELIGEDLSDEFQRNPLAWESSLLLVGGDVAHCVELERLFYEELRRRWRGAIVAVLGNHELWYGDSDGLGEGRALSAIFEDYERALSESGVHLLENALLFKYKGRTWQCISEGLLLEADTDDLEELCRESTCIVLGGLGFSGRNPQYNAALGLYRAAVDSEEDERCSERFRAVYERVMHCAEHRQVIVLTHMQMANWSSAGYNPNWVYISGHTHQNVMIRSDDGTTVLSDNQIGYEPKEWNLHCFTRRGVYDPLELLSDGIHPISKEQYVDFNRGHGITMRRFKWKGDLYALKRNDYYMFFIKNTSLCMLEGGRRHKVECSLEYYFENMDEYTRQIEAAFRPYRTALRKLANEVREFGGSGRIHGCIIDIDFFRHIYLNPFDGTITPYRAFSMYSWEGFPSVPALLSAEPAWRFSQCEHTMLERYEKALVEGSIPILAHRAMDEGVSLETVPEIVFDTEFAYDSSLIAKKIQYVLDQRVIRVWNDDVLGEARKMLPDLKRKTQKLEAAKPKPVRAKLTREERIHKRAKDYAEKVHQKSKGKLKVMPEDYVSSRDKVKVRCLECGWEWERRADHLLERCLCPKCMR